MEDKRFKTLDEYDDELDKIYEDEGTYIDILDFLREKKQEAVETGDQMLSDHIETIYKEAYERRKEMQRIEEERHNQYDSNGFNYYGIHRDTGTEYDEQGYDINGFDDCGIYKTGGFYDEEGYNRLGYNENGWNRDGIYETTGTIYDSDGYKIDGYNEEGYNRGGWNKEGIHKDTKTIYNEEGWTNEGINKNTGTKYNEQGYDKDGYDEQGFNEWGWNREGINKKTGTYYDEHGYDDCGLDSEGYYRSGYNEEGYNREGYNWEGFTRYGEYNEYFDERLKSSPIDETLNRTKEPEELENMSEDELQQLIANNEQIIEENKKALSIKKALIERVLAQQETIAEQQAEMNRLNSQKKEL